MDKKMQNKKISPDREEIRHPAQQKTSADAEKMMSSGISQPHNAKKEALGPNTNR